jgi:hypothetical protein
MLKKSTNVLISAQNYQNSTNQRINGYCMLSTLISKVMNIIELLNGHVVIKLTNSGKDFGLTKSGKPSKGKKVSKAWLQKNISEWQFNALMNGEIIDKTVRRGRGFSYVEYQRVAI